MNIFKKFWRGMISKKDQLIKRFERRKKKAKSVRNPHVEAAIRNVTNKYDTERRRRNAAKEAAEKREKSRRVIRQKSIRIARGTIKGYAKRS